MGIDARKLKEEYIFTGKGPAAELLQEMDRISAMAKKFESRVFLVRWSALAVFLFFLVLGIALTGFFIFVGFVAAVGILVGSMVMAASGVVAGRAEFLRLNLSMLSQDAGSKGSFQVMLRLRPNRQKLSEVPNPRHKGGREIWFRDSWLTLNGRLSDGTSIYESCTDLVRQRIRSNANGKRKTKERTNCSLRIQLTYDPLKYGKAPAAARAIQNPFRLPGTAQMKAFTFDEKSLAVKALVRSNPTGDALHAANEAILLGAYRILNLARKSRPAVGGAQ
jgi:hypothetical protein